MSSQLDITRDVCPMTTVKIGMALARLKPGDRLEVRLKQEALRNVAASLKLDGHRIAAVYPEDQGHLLVVEKAGAATAEAAP